MLDEGTFRIILRLKDHGLSERYIAKELSIARNTVRRYLQHYQQEQKLMKNCYDNGDEMGFLLHKKRMRTLPKYDSSTRVNRVFTEEVAKEVMKILKKEEKKSNNTKQRLTAAQVRERLLQLGYNISLSTVNNKLSMLRKNM